MRKFWIMNLAMITALLWLAAAPALAFNVTPLVIEIDAEPGERVNGQITLWGDESDSDLVRIYAVDWDRDANGDYAINAPGATERSCMDWLSLDSTQLEVPAGATMHVKYSLTVPDNATGSYWSFIMMEGISKPVKPPEGSDGRQVVIGARLRYAIRLVVNVEQGSLASGAITKIQVDAQAPDAKQNADGLMVKILFQNTGNAYVKPFGYVQIRDLDGKTVAQAEIKEFYIFPGRSLWVNAAVNDLLPDGKYLALAVLDYGGEALVAGEARFTVQQTEDPQDTPGGEVR